MRERFESIEYLVGQIVGFPVNIAIGGSGQPGVSEYQIMPPLHFHEEAENFFDWYCDNHPNNQFHAEPEYAGAEFVKYFYTWRALCNWNKSAV